jgi:hypothetical protein
LNGATPSSLYWFPLAVEELMALAASMTPEQLGALFRLRAFAWRQNPPATLPRDPARLAVISGLGDRWAAESAPLMERMVDLESHPDRIAEGWLLDRYREQLAKYVSASTRGRTGGRPRTKADGKPPEKLSDSSGLHQLHSALNSGLQVVAVENGEQRKADPNLSESSAIDALSLARSAQERAWMADNPGKPLPLTFHLGPKP